MNPERLRGINGADEEGDDDESDEESESSGVEEDELGEEMTPEMDLQLFRTIAAIRTKDKSVYEEKRSFFDGRMALLVQ